MKKPDMSWTEIRMGAKSTIFATTVLLLSACDARVASTRLSPQPQASDSSGATFSFLSERPKDASNWIGDGYDMLSGQRRASCLDMSQTVIRTYPLNRAVDTLYLVGSRSELANKLQLEVNAETSGTYKTFTGNASIKTAIVRETAVNENSITAVAEYRYLKDEIAVYNSVPLLADDKLALLQQDNVLFRRECGDKLTRVIRTGASLYLIFKAEKVEQTTHSQTQVESAMKLGFGSIIGFNPSSKLNDEQKQIVSKFKISCKCYSEGTSAHPCADNMLNATGLSLDERDNTILERIKSAKMALANDIDNGRNIVTVDEELEPYEIPSVFGNKGLFEVFFDYRGTLDKIQQWLKVEDQVTALCSSVDFLDEACERATRTIGEALENCAVQRNLVAGSCRAPGAGEFDEILGANSAGELLLCEDGSCRGRKLTLRFDNLYTGYGSLYPDVLYNLHHDPFRFSDIASCYQAGNLRPGWKVVLYENADGGGRQAEIPAGQVYGNVPSGFNDKASSFRLMRAQ